MRLTRTIRVGDPERDVTIRETTVAEMRVWLHEMEKIRTEQIDFVTHGLLNDASLSDITMMSNLTMEDLDGMVPSEIKVVVAACQEINPDFFSIRSRRLLMMQMDAHNAYAKLRQDEKWLIADPGLTEPTSTP